MVGGWWWVDGGGWVLVIGCWLGNAGGGVLVGETLPQKLHVIHVIDKIIRVFSCDKQLKK